MTWHKIRFYFAEAGRSLYRNRLLSLATATTVAACVLILGIGALLVVNAQEIMTSLESDVEVVAFLEKGMSKQQRIEIGKELEYMPGIKQVEFVSKDKAITHLEKRFGQGQFDLRKTLGGDNPLPDSYRIKASDPHKVPSLAKRIQEIPGVSKIRYGQGVVEKLFAVTNWVRTISLVVIVLLACAAIFLIATTIRLTIYSRREEIYLMKLVGATDWFVRWPLFIEGISLGLMGALMSVVVLAVGYYYLVNNLSLAVTFIPLVTDQDLLVKLLVGLLATGAGIGLIGTFISANRYMDV
ncbi:MAG: ABC transporter permease [Syntrophomonadaceae bacterium]|jgi:cell division transport system permease protein|nr:ABC transporter permease [Syntrophomonadaceae bacterium]